MSTILPYLINWLQLYGYPALWLSIFVAAAGVPLPIGFVLLAAGAFAALGDFNIIILGLVAFTASVCGDSLGYLIGRLLGHRLLTYVEQRKKLRLFSSERLARAQMYFRRRGGLAIFFTRFLVSALGGITNLIAGTELYPYPRFLLFDITGELIGVLLSLVLGFTFGETWEAVGDILGAISLLVLALVLATYLIIRFIRLARGSAASRIIHKRPGAELAATQHPPLTSRGNISDSLPL